MSETDVAVIGGGLVGMSVAYGLQRRGHHVTVFDEDDRALRASRGNFGLVWVQGKGANLPDYARWTLLSASLWPAFRDELEEDSSVGVELSQPGGFDICLSEEDAESTVQRLTELRAALDGEYPFSYLDHNALKEMVPEIGRSVVGATYCPKDGHVNPLYLLRALHSAFRRKGGRLVNGAKVDRITPLKPGFEISHAGTWRAERVVLAAGLGNTKLAPMVGLTAPLRPNRGQVLVTERVRRFLHYPTVQIRQVGEGAVQIGDSQEDAGFDDGTTPEVIAHLVRRAVSIYPLLEHVRVVRSWAALRVMSADGHPIYDMSRAHAGAAQVACHSGVTLAAAHALVLSAWLDGDQAPDYMDAFSAERFALA